MTSFLADPRFRPSGESLLSDYRFRRRLERPVRLPTRRDGRRPPRRLRMPELFVPPREPNRRASRSFRLSVRRRHFGRDNALDRLEGEAWLRRMYALEERLGSFEGARQHPSHEDGSSVEPVAERPRTG